MGAWNPRCYKPAPSRDLPPPAAPNLLGGALTFAQIVVLSLVQGVTEFLPISSHAHLILARHLMRLPETGLSFDIAVHVGTLGAVIVYYWRDMLFMAGGLLRLASGRGGPGAKLFGLVVVATLPVVVAGYLVERYAGETLNTVPVIAWTTVLFAVVLYAADRLCMTLRRIEHMTALQAVAIGAAQVLALLPGVSRSGITMTAGRVLGFERTESVRFSLLMSVPAILGAGVLDGYKLYESGDFHLAGELGLAAVLAFVSALIAIPLMVGWLRRASFTPFVVYRLILGGILLALLYWV